MPDIVLDFPISAPAKEVFRGISTPAGLDKWWTKESSGEPRKGAEYRLWFGPEYDWRAVVSRCDPHKEFELKLIQADRDWLDTRVGFALEQKDGTTIVRFHHLGWPEANEHFRISCYCWAMYLRHLKRFVESGIVVEYEDRLNT